MKSTCMRFAALLTVLILTTSVSAKTNYVSATSGNDANNGLSWATAKQTIQAAVNVAVDGDTVLVSNGVYHVSSQITVTKGVTVRGTSREAVVDGGGVTRCLYVSHALATLDSLTIQRGSSDQGAGVYCSGGTIQNCTVTANNAVGVGETGLSMYGGGL